MTDAEGITITRTFAAPRELVYEAWTTPDQFGAWWGGSAVTVPTDSVEMDVRKGGTWKATMIIGNGVPNMDWFGEFLEVDPPSKLVMTLADRPGDERETVTVTFTPAGDGTEMLSRQTGGHMSAEDYERTAEGWRGFFDAMAEIVEK